MVNKWHSTTWGEIASLEYGKGLRNYEDSDGKYRVYGTNGPIGWHNEPLCRHSGVVVGRKGAYRGIHYSRDPFFVIDTAFYIEPKRELDARWSFYCLLTYDINGMDSGSAIPSTSREAFYRLPVQVPPLPEQKAIAHILGSLDDKIELNQKMNQTLEEMARAIFKSWFVDFDPVWAKKRGQKPVGMDAATAALFPNDFEDSKLGKIPKGWKVGTIGDIAQKVAMGPFGSNIKVETFVPEGVPIISGQHLKGTILEDNKYNFITIEHAERQKNSLVQRGDIIFTHAGNIGNVAYIPETARYEKYIVSQRQFYLRCNSQLMSPLYIIYYFKSSEGQHRLLANTSSVGVPSIAQPSTYLKKIELVIPAIPIIDTFAEFVVRTHRMFGTNINLTNTLASLRDTLLPKLMSGEIRVKDAEKIVEEVL